MGEEIVGGVLERIAVALESIGEKIGMALEALADGEEVEDAMPEVANTGYVTPDYNAKDIRPEVVITPKVDLIRPGLLARCKELGITVPQRTRNTTLVRWIAEEVAKPSQPVIEVESKTAIDVEVAAQSTTSAVVIPEAEVQASVTYTRDDAREALVDLCKLKGNDTELCTGILKEHGAVNITDLSESKFPDFMASIKKAGGVI